MEGETEEKQGESIKSGTTSTQVDTLTENCCEDSNKPSDLELSEEDDQAEGADCDRDVKLCQVGEDLCVSDAKTLPQETPIATSTEDSADGRPLSMLTEEDVNPSSVSSHPSNTQNSPSGPCWYCLRSLDSEYHPETPNQEDSDSLSPPPSSDQKVNYQTDPRPHFGVAWSSRSTCQPLWGNEGPYWRQRNQEVLDERHTCPHCYLGLPPDTLRWHEAKCMQFEKLRNSETK